MSEYARVENAEDKAFGLREKYAVTRIGGTPHKHDDCDYFVLDWNHDRYARVAALAYADACEAEWLLTCESGPPRSRRSGFPTS